MELSLENLVRAAFPRVSSAVAAKFPRQALAGIMDAASLPGRAYVSLADNGSYLDALGRTSAAPGQRRADTISEDILRDPTSILGIGAGGLAKAAGKKLAATAAGKIAPWLIPYAADAVANAGTSAAAQYGTTGSIAPTQIAANAGLGLGMQGLGSAVAKVAPKARVAIMENPNFRKWFGGSKVVDEAGNPLVVYHGTDQSFESFDPELLGKLTGAASAKKGFFFTDNPENAAFYAGWTPSKEGYEYVNNLVANRKSELEDLENQLSQLKRGENAKLRRVDKESRLSDFELINYGYSSEEIKSLRNNEWNYSPEELSRDAQAREVMRKIKAAEEGIDAAQTLAVANSIGRDFKSGMMPNIMPVNLGLKNPLIHEQAGDFRDIKYSDLLDQAKASGKDGLVIKGSRDPLRGNVYVAFEPTQIKSATGNRGTFDPSDPNITHLAGGNSRSIQMPGFAKRLASRYMNDTASTSGRN